MSQLTIICDCGVRQGIDGHMYFLGNDGKGPDWWDTHPHLPGLFTLRCVCGDEITAGSDLVPVTNDHAANVKACAEAGRSDAKAALLWYFGTHQHCTGTAH